MSTRLDPSKDKMTGADLVKQEEHELDFERGYIDHCDRVKRRDDRGEIISSIASPAYRRGFDAIDWNAK